MMEWEQSSTFHLHVHGFRERIRHAFRILTTGQTLYRYTFYHTSLGDPETEILVDDRVMIPVDSAFLEREEL